MTFYAKQYLMLRIPGLNFHKTIRFIIRWVVSFAKWFCHDVTLCESIKIATYFKEQSWLLVKSNSGRHILYWHNSQPNDKQGIFFETSPYSPGSGSWCWKHRANCTLLPKVTGGVQATARAKAGFGKGPIGCAILGVRKMLLRDECKGAIWQM